MEYRPALLLFCCAAALAQPAIRPPDVGTIRDSSGSLYTVTGIPGNFIAAEAGISGIISAAFSGSAGLLKTDAELVVMNAKNEVIERWTAPAGPALFAFDLTGAPALAYYSGALRGLGPKPTHFNLDGDVLSVAAAGPDAAAIVRRGDCLWSLRIALDSGTVGETLLPNISGPVFLLAGGGLLFTRESDIVLRGEGGAERTINAPFAVQAFESMGKDWIAIRESGGDRLFALHVTARALELYQVPEVAP